MDVRIRMLCSRIWAVNLLAVSYYIVSSVCGLHPRDMHQQLLVRITLQFGLLVQSLSPCLLYDLCTASRFALVQCIDRAKVDLLVDVVLQRRSEIVRVVVGRTLGVVVAVVLMFIVAV